MDNDFLDGIDEQFQRLMKLNGNGKTGGRSTENAREDPLVAEIVEHLNKLSRTQREELLKYIRSLEAKD